MEKEINLSLFDGLLDEDRNILMVPDSPDGLDDLDSVSSSSDDEIPKLGDDDDEMDNMEEKIMIERTYGKQLKRFFRNDLQFKRKAIREKDVLDFDLNDVLPPDQYIVPSYPQHSQRVIKYFDVWDVERERFVVVSVVRDDTRLEILNQNMKPVRTAIPYTFQEGQDIFTMSSCPSKPRVVIILLEGELQILEFDEESERFKIRDSSLVNEPVFTFGDIVFGKYGFLIQFAICINQNTFFIGDNLRGFYKKIRLRSPSTVLAPGASQSRRESRSKSMTSQYGEYMRQYCFVKNKLLFCTEKGIWRLDPTDDSVDVYITDMLNVHTMCIHDHYLFVSNSNYIRMYDVRDTEYPSLSVTIFENLLDMKVMPIKCEFLPKIDYSLASPEQKKKKSLILEDRKRRKEMLLLITYDESFQFWVYRIKDDRLISFPFPLSLTPPKSTSPLTSPPPKSRTKRRRQQRKSGGVLGSSGHNNSFNSHLYPTSSSNYIRFTYIRPFVTKNQQTVRLFGVSENDTLSWVDFHFTVNLSELEESSDRLLPRISEKKLLSPKLDDHTTDMIEFAESPKKKKGYRKKKKKRKKIRRGSQRKTQKSSSSTSRVKRELTFNDIEDVEDLKELMGSFQIPKQRRDMNDEDEEEDDEEEITDLNESAVDKLRNSVQLLEDEMSRDFWKPKKKKRKKRVRYIEDESFRESSDDDDDMLDEDGDEEEEEEMDALGALMMELSQKTADLNRSNSQSTISSNQQQKQKQQKKKRQKSNQSGRSKVSRRSSTSANFTVASTRPKKKKKRKKRRKKENLDESDEEENVPKIRSALRQDSIERREQHKKEKKRRKRKMQIIRSSKIAGETSRGRRGGDGKKKDLLQGILDETNFSKLSRSMDLVDDLENLEDRIIDDEDDEDPMDDLDDILAGSGIHSERGKRRKELGRHNLSLNIEKEFDLDLDNIDDGKEDDDSLLEFLNV